MRTNEIVNGFICMPRIGGELMAAFPAEILLKPIFIFAVTIKRMIIVAFRVVNMVYFNHETPAPFWEAHGFVVKLLNQKGWRVFNFH